MTPHLTAGQHQDVFLLLRLIFHVTLLHHIQVRTYLREPQLSPGQPRCLQLPLGEVELPGDDAGYLLLPGYPVQGHLGPHVIVQSSVGVVLDHLLSAALSLSHGLQRAVPVEELEDRHDLLELQHGLAEVLLQHEPVCSDARAGLCVCSDSLINKVYRSNDCSSIFLLIFVQENKSNKCFFLGNRFNFVC